MNAKSTSSPFILGEHFALSLVLAWISEKCPTQDARRTRLENWAKKNIPLLIKEGNEKGDMKGVLKRALADIEAQVSQREADRKFREESCESELTRKAVNEALASGNVMKALETKVHFLLKAKERRDLKHPDIRNLVLRALLAGDNGVFIRLARALAQPPQPFGPEHIQIDKLKFLLSQYWISGPEGQVGLCRLTDEALTEFCKLELKNEKLSMDSVRKARQRLGLKKGPKPWFNHVEKKNGIMTLSRIPLVSAKKT